jgi:hypothetical protein
MDAFFAGAAFRAGAVFFADDALADFFAPPPLPDDFDADLEDDALPADAFLPPPLLFFAGALFRAALFDEDDFFAPAFLAGMAFRAGAAFLADFDDDLLAFEPDDFLPADDLEDDFAEDFPEDFFEDFLDAAIHFSLLKTGRLGSRTFEARDVELRGNRVAQPRAINVDEHVALVTFDIALAAHAAMDSARRRCGVAGDDVRVRLHGRAQSPPHA